MGRQLVFWKNTDGIYPDSHEVYEKICTQENISGLESLDINKILGRISDVFSEWCRLDEYNFESQNGAFTVEIYENAVLFECSESMDYSSLNKIIDIMLEFDCPLYDPQINVRFDNKEM